MKHSHDSSHNGSSHNGNGHALLPGSPPQPNSGSVNAKLVLQTLARWWHIATPVGLLLAGAAAFAIYATFIPEYKSTVLLEIKPPPALFGRGGDPRQSLSNQEAYLKAGIVLEAALEKIDIASVRELSKAKDPLRELEKRINIERWGRSNFYEISYRSYDPKDAAQIVTAVTDAYRSLYGSWENQGQRSRLEHLEAMLKEKRTELADIQERLRTMSVESLEQGGQLGGGMGGASVTIPAGLVELEKQLSSLRNEKLSLQIDKQIAQERLKDLPNSYSQEELDKWLEQNEPAIIQTRMRIEATEEQIKQLEAGIADLRRTTVNPESHRIYQSKQRKLSQLQQNLEELQAELESVRQRARKERLEQFKKYTADLIERQLKSYELAEQKLDLLIKARQEEYEKAKREFASVAGTAVADRIISEMEATSTRMIIESLEKQIESLGYQSQAETARVASAAKVSSTPVELIPIKKMVAAGGAVFFIPFGLALLWEIRVRRVSDPSTVEESANIPIVGEIASLPTRRIGTRNGHSSSLWMFEESIDSLRTTLMVDADIADARVFAVTSAVSQEGKTSVAAQLAVSIARATGKRTVIVDGDMRAPDLHNIFDVEPDSAGLAEVLSEECSLDDAISDTATDNLDVLPAGQLRCNPHSLVGNGHFESFLNQLKQEYTYIVLDTPPLLAAAESVMIAKHADASLLCAMRDSSRLDQLRKAYHRLQKAQAHPVGVVLNGIPTRHYAYRYGSYAYSKKR